MLKWSAKIQKSFLGILRYFYVKLSLYIQHRREKPPKLNGNLLFGPPDFIGIGFQKCGTTWWYELIASHPNFFDPKTIFKGKVRPAHRYKERNLFKKFVNQAPSPDEIDGFQMWYPRTEGTITGEWTPNYIIQYWVPPIVARLWPNTKIIVMLRDPVIRFASGVNHALKRKGILQHPDYFVHYLQGFYYNHLDLWKNYFKDDQFLILQYEKCVRDPQNEINRTFNFLGLKEIILSSAQITRLTNVGSKTFKLTEEQREALVKAYKDQVLQLAEHYPDLDLSLWENFKNI